MEEQQNYQVITIFIRSNQIQDLRIDIFDSFDALIANFTIANYNSHTIQLSKYLRRFYCIATNNQHHIQEQFQVKVSEEEEAKPLFQYSKKFKGFSVNIQIEQRKSLQKVLIFQKFMKQQPELVKFANNHLKKLQNTVFKKIQVEQLKRPLTNKHNTNKSNSMRKLNKNLTFKKLPKDNPKKYLANRVKDLELTLKSLSKPNQQKSSEQSQKSDQSLMLRTMPSSNTKRKKHNTLFEQNQIRKTQMSTKQLNQQQKHNEDYYYQFIKALKYTSKQNQSKFKRIKLTRPSHNQLEISTLVDMERQKKAFEVVNTMKGVYSYQNSPVKITNSQKIINNQKQSPYLIMSSRAFVRKKVK